MTTTEAAAWLAARDNFLILTHVRPDGDTLGSACALCAGLRAAGKTAFVLRNPQLTRRYREFTEPYWIDAFKADYILTADIAAEQLFPQGGEGYLGKVDLAIDHHPSNTYFAKELVLGADRAACGEIVYEILLALNGSVNPEAAKMLFIALTTDTGCFRYGNTTANTYRVASELIEAGAPGTEINKRLFRTQSRARIELEREILGGLDFTRDGKVATVVLTQEIIRKTKADEDDLEDIASIHGQIEGVIVSITIREQADGMSKLSVRSNHLVDSGAVCALLGGGGHLMAAGAMLNCGVWEAKARVLAAVDEVWK